MESDYDGVVSVELVTGVVLTKWQDENFSFPRNDFTAECARSVEVAHLQVYRGRAQDYPEEGPLAT